MPLKLQLYLAETSRLEAAIARLPPSESRDAQRYKSERRRVQHLGGRALLRLAAGRNGAPTFASTAVAGDEGAPRLPDLPHLTVSLSHTSTWVACLLAENAACGVDLQRKVEKPLIEIAQAFFTSEEHADLAALGDAARADRFYAGWTLKEAWTKASGADLLTALSRVRVARPDESDTREWLAWSFSPAPDVAGALVVHASTAPAPTIHVWRGDDFETADLACERVALAIRDA